MAFQHLTPVNFNLNELQNGTVQNLATAPSTPAAGRFYFDTTLHQFGVYTGTAWAYLSASLVTSVAATNATIVIGGTATAPTVGIGTLAESNITNLVTDLAATEKSANKGAVNGYCPLDSGSKVPVANLPASVLGGLAYQGAWNASTNIPALASSTGTKGFYYDVSVTGTTALDGISAWAAGDKAAYNGTVWEKFEGQNNVSSVNSRIGAVVLAGTDIPAFVASGGSHAPGAVPDPGATLGTVKFLREDGTWVIPTDTNSGGTVKKFAANIGAITGGTPIVIAHGLATADATWNVVDTSGNSVYPDVKIDSTNVTLTFAATYVANTYRVIVTG